MNWKDELLTILIFLTIAIPISAVLWMLTVEIRMVVDYIILPLMGIF